MAPGRRKKRKKRVKLRAGKRQPTMYMVHAEQLSTMLGPLFAGPLERGSPAKRRATLVESSSAFDKFAAATAELVPGMKANTAAELWVQFDEDGSGTLTLDELASRFSAMGEKVSTDDMKVAMATLDTDNDGTVDFSEFQALCDMLGIFAVDVVAPAQSATAPLPSLNETSSTTTGGTVFRSTFCLNRDWLKRNSEAVSRATEAPAVRLARRHNAAMRGISGGRAADILDHKTSQTKILRSFLPPPPFAGEGVGAVSSLGNSGKLEPMLNYQHNPRAASAQPVQTFGNQPRSAARTAASAGAQGPGTRTRRRQGRRRRRRSQQQVGVPSEIMPPAALAARYSQAPMASASLTKSTGMKREVSDTKMRLAEPRTLEESAVVKAFVGLRRRQPTGEELKLLMRRLFPAAAAATSTRAFDETFMAMSNKLPPGWVKRESNSMPGTFYYYNEKTGESTWTKPKVVAEKRAFGTAGEDAVAETVVPGYSRVRCQTRGGERIQTDVSLDFDKKTVAVRMESLRNLAASPTGDTKKADGTAVPIKSIAFGGTEDLFGLAATAQNRTVAATIVQSAWRMALWRSHHDDCRAASLVMQCWARTMFAKRRVHHVKAIAAKRLQRLCRGYQARKRVKRKRQRRAMRAIQPFLRGVRVRLERRRMGASASAMQAAFRGRASRKRADAERRAVILVQAAVRRRMVRASFLERARRAAIFRDWRMRMYQHARFVVSSARFRVVLPNAPSPGRYKHTPPPTVTPVSTSSSSGGSPGRVNKRRVRRSSLKVQSAAAANAQAAAAAAAAAVAKEPDPTVERAELVVTGYLESGTLRAGKTMRFTDTPLHGSIVNIAVVCPDGAGAKVAGKMTKQPSRAGSGQGLPNVQGASSKNDGGGGGGNNGRGGEQGDFPSLGRRLTHLTSSPEAGGGLDFLPRQGVAAGLSSMACAAELPTASAGMTIDTCTQIGTQMEVKYDTSRFPICVTLAGEDIQDAYDRVVGVERKRGGQEGGTAEVVDRGCPPRMYGHGLSALTLSKGSIGYLGAQSHPSDGGILRALVADVTMMSLAGLVNSSSKSISVAKSPFSSPLMSPTRQNTIAKEMAEVVMTMPAMGFSFVRRMRTVAALENVLHRVQPKPIKDVDDDGFGSDVDDDVIRRDALGLLYKGDYGRPRSKKAKGKASPNSKLGGGEVEQTRPQRSMSLYEAKETLSLDSQAELKEALAGDALRRARALLRLVVNVELHGAVVPCIVAEANYCDNREDDDDEHLDEIQEEKTSSATAADQASLGRRGSMESRLIGKAVAAQMQEKRTKRMAKLRKRPVRLVLLPLEPATGVTFDDCPALGSILVRMDNIVVGFGKIVHTAVADEFTSTWQLAPSVPGDNGGVPRSLSPKPSFPDSNSSVTGAMAVANAAPTDMAKAMLDDFSSAFGTKEEDKDKMSHEKHQELHSLIRGHSTASFATKMNPGQRSPRRTRSSIRVEGNVYGVTGGHLLGGRKMGKKRKRKLREQVAQAQQIAKDFPGVHPGLILDGIINHDLRRAVASAVLSGTLHTMSRATQLALIPSGSLIDLSATSREMTWHVPATIERACLALNLLQHSLPMPHHAVLPAHHVPSRKLSCTWGWEAPAKKRHAMVASRKTQAAIKGEARKAKAKPVKAKIQRSEPTSIVCDTRRLEHHEVLSKKHREEDSHWADVEEHFDTAQLTHILHAEAWQRNRHAMSSAAREYFGALPLRAVVLHVPSEWTRGNSGSDEVEKDLLVDYVPSKTVSDDDVVHICVRVSTGFLQLGEPYVVSPSGATAYINAIVSRDAGSAAGLKRLVERRTRGMAAS